MPRVTVGRRQPRQRTAEGRMTETQPPTTRRTVDRTQAIALGVWLLFGTGVIYFGWHLAMFGRRGGPGSGFFLKSLAALLILLVLVRAVSLWREGRRQVGTSAANESEPRQGFEAANVGRFLLLVLSLTLYATLLPTLGFLVATSALCWASLMLFGRPALRSLIEAVVGTVLVQIAFTHGLGVPLPETTVALLRGLGL